MFVNANRFQFKKITKIKKIIYTSNILIQFDSFSFFFFTQTNTKTQSVQHETVLMKS